MSAGTIDALRKVADRLGATIETIGLEQPTSELTYHAQGMRAGLRMAKETIEFQIELTKIMSKVQPGENA